MVSEVMDLPHPDSPTSPMVWRGRTTKLTWSTTFTSPWRGNLMHRSLTSRMGGTSVRASKRSVRVFSTACSSARRRLSDSAWAL